MLRLIIADDEKIIRETIRSFIDWSSLGIEVVATCKNGLEAYDAILDTYPDIVLTDIKMPGLSGLELIERLTKTHDQIQFILLSGYEEFEYARKAMHYGIKHYLLKPCNEAQIIEAVNDVRKYCRQEPEPPKATLPSYKPFIEDLLRYVKEHLSDSSISLKWISNNYLFMNVDYVSKEFYRQTGMKFSRYINQLRMEKAKDLLSKCNAEKIYDIAEQVGCGNNPQYFSQLFKKYTGMSPTEYAQKSSPAKSNAISKNTTEHK